jgi:sugar phosphate isomerase/epimerase
MSRRGFLERALAGAAAAGLAGGFAPLAGCAKGKRRLHDIGLQLLTVSKEIQKDWKAALKTVAEIGYTNLEMGGALGGSVPDFLAFCRDLGLVPFAGGADIGTLRKSLDGEIEEALSLGKKWVMCYWPWEGPVENKTLDDWKRVAADLNPIGEKVRKAGLGFAYHNHALEFEPTEGRLPYDLLLENTDPALVDMEIDLYWIEKGGCRAVPFFEKHPGRFPLWHVKDMDATADKSFACVGEGVLDFASVFAKADVAGLEHVFVEHDKPEDGLACARVSYETLRAMRY